MSGADVSRLTAEVAELRAALARLGLIQAEALNAIAEITRAEARSSGIAAIMYGDAAKRLVAAAQESLDLVQTIGLSDDR